MSKLERFILKIPYILLWRVSYLWFLVVIFYTWPPIFSGILVIFIILSLLVIKLQDWLWEGYIKRDSKARKVSPYIDHPKAPFAYQARNLALVILFGLIAYFLLDEQLGLTGLQWFLLAVGFFILQMGVRLFGAPTAYVVTDEGIWLGYVNFRLFFRFDEIRQAVRFGEIKSMPENWTRFTPVKLVRHGVLLVPTGVDGFTKWIKEIFISPTNVDEFLKRIPKPLVVDQT